MKKYKDNKCLNCGEPCWRSSSVCGLCFLKVFKNNKGNLYDDFMSKKRKKQ